MSMTGIILATVIVGGTGLFIGIFLLKLHFFCVSFEENHTPV